MLKTQCSASLFRLLIEKAIINNYGFLATGKGIEPYTPKLVFLLKYIYIQILIETEPVEWKCLSANLNYQML